MAIEASIFPIYGNIILNFFIRIFPRRGENTISRNMGVIIPAEKIMKRINGPPSTREAESIISRIGREQVKELNAYINP